MLTLLDHLFIGKDATLFLNHPALKSPESSAKAGTTAGPWEESKVGLLANTLASLDSLRGSRRHTPWEKSVVSRAPTVPVTPWRQY